MLQKVAHTRHKVRAILFVLMMSSLFLSSFVETVVIHKNTANGVYTTETKFDMVRIPMMFGGLFQLITAFFFALSLAIPRTKYWGALSIFVALITLYFTVGSLGYWLDPNHYQISIGHIPSAIVAVLWIWNVWVIRREKINEQKLSAS
jgi:hypothetical protein